MSMDDAAGVLARADFFDICDDEQLRMLGFAGDRQFFGVNSVIYKAGDVPDGAYVLINGRVRAEHDGPEPGKPYTIASLGSVISPTALILSKPRPVTFTADADSELLFVPRSAFLKLARQNPDLAQRAAQRIQENLGNYMHALEPLRSRIGRG